MSGRAGRAAIMALLALAALAAGATLGSGAVPGRGAAMGALPAAASSAGEPVVGGSPHVPSWAPAGSAAPRARAPAGPAETDTTLEKFLDTLADSTDRYFGLSAAPVDTAGIDSALAFALANPRVQGTMRRFGLNLRPDFAFNRADGPTYGGEIGVGRAAVRGEVFGVAKYAVGPNDWLGGGGVRRRGTIGTALGALELFGGRRTVPMNQDLEGRHLASLRALVNGKDYRRYYREEGFEATSRLERETWRLGLGFRAMRERPLVTTTTWTLTGRDPVVLDNLAARAGRIREIAISGEWRVPRLPVTAEVTHQTAGTSIGSDFEYRRTRVALAGDFGLGQYATLVPQVSYGRLTPRVIPQEAFYLGGSHTLRSLPGDARGGTGMALARLDLVGTRDVLALAHIPHPAAFPIQAGLFAATGAVWGADPYGGPAVTGDLWPHRESWLSEAGAALIYQPGIPDPTLMIRLNFAQPIGPARETTRWTISITRALDVVKPLGEQ